MSGSYYTLDGKYNTLNSELRANEAELATVKQDLVVATGKIPPEQLTQWRFGTQSSNLTSIQSIGTGQKLFSTAIGGCNYQVFKTMETGTGESTAQWNNTLGTFTVLVSGNYTLDFCYSAYSGSSYNNVLYFNAYDTAGVWGISNVVKGGSTPTYTSYGGAPVLGAPFTLSANIYFNAGDTFNFSSAHTTGYFYSHDDNTNLTITKLTGYDAAS